MSQTVLSVVAEVQPLSAAQLRDIVFQLREREETVPPGQQAFARWMTSIPLLHFLSMTVFDDDAYDPVFVIEANFDGAPGPFWAQLEAVIGTELREMLRCCKPPRDGRKALFEAVTRAGSRAPVAPLLEAFTIRPIVFHQGNRGLDRARITDEAKVFFEVRQELDTGRYASLATAAGVHRALREKLVGRFPWLDEKVPTRVTAAENVADFLRLVGVGGAAVAVLLPVAAVLVPWLLWLERRDPVTDAPKLEPKVMREMAEREDWLAQNHMISVVQLKPGVLRAIVVRVGLRLLGLYLRVFGHSGYLSSMRTIHFAHWAIISNGARLMFHSNFDGSWESYLDDFIEKAHGGLTLAWTSGVGFPPTRLLFLDGATNGRTFKAWARHTMAGSQLWFTAYKSYTVNQIERHARVVDGLRRRELGDREARAWANDL